MEPPLAKSPEIVLIVSRKGGSAWLSSVWVGRCSRRLFVFGRLSWRVLRGWPERINSSILS